MKTFVFSDSHGCFEPMKEVIRVGRPDAVVFLGDFVYDIERVMCDTENVSFFVVRGNNDFLSREPERLFTSVGERKIFATHGHLYRDSLSLLLAAKEKNADTVLFGHTHRPLLTQDNGVLLMNPGSVRDTKTYGVLIDGSEPQIKRM